MRVLHWPIYSLIGNPLADSGYICYRNLIRAIPEWTHHLVVPEWVEAMGRTIKDDLDDMPNVHKIIVPMDTLYRTQEVVLDPATVWQYSPQKGPQPVDAVIAGSNQIAATLANSWSIRTEAEERPLVVAWDLLTRDDNQKGWHSEDIELMMHFTGAAVADLNIYGSEMMRWMTGNMLRKYFSPAVVREVLQNRSETVYAGIPAQRIRAVTDKVKKRDKFTVFYGGRMGAVKRVDDLTEIADIAFKFGRDMHMVICTGALNGYRKREFEAKYPMVELHVGTGQEEAWNLMAECHAAFSWSRHEMIGSMFIEEMAGGLPLIAYRHRWIESLLPEEYPYWASNAREAGAVLRYLYEEWKKDPDNYDAEARKWSDYVAENYDSEVSGQRFRGIVEDRIAGRREEAVAEVASGKRNSLMGLVEETITEGMSFDELVDAVRAASTGGKAFLGNTLHYGRSHPLAEAYQAAILLGWKDIGLEYPIFTKEETE